MPLPRIHCLVVLQFLAGIFYFVSICATQQTPSVSSSFTATQQTTITTRTPLYLGAFFPFGGGWDGSGVIPAVEMALDHVNARPDILPGYELKMIWEDTQCEAGLGTRQLFDQIFDKPQKLMILGGGCSTATQAIAATAYHWNLVTMSYAASSSALSNRKVYPYFYRTYMPDAMYNPARVHLMKLYGWQRVATIHENHELFSLAIDDLHNILTEENITVISAESFIENPKNQVQNLKNQDAKIIVANMYENKARRVFCEAYKQGITGEGYVWMLIGWYNHEWWEKQDDHIDCTPEEMREAVKGYISVESLQLGDPDVVTVANITSADYVTLLRQRLDWPQYKNKYQWNTLSPYGYDATWAIALMLNETMNKLSIDVSENNHTKRLEDFNYDDNDMAKLFFEYLQQTQFIGVTGPVSFKDADRVGITQVEQLRVGCDPNWYHHDRYCYRLNEAPTSWSEAYSSCQSMDSQLVQLDNETEQFIIDIMEDGGNNQWLLQAWVVTVAQCGYYTVDYSDYCPTIRSTDSYAECEPMSCSSSLPYICRQGDHREKQIALFDALEDKLTWRTQFTNQSLWPDETIPLDHTPEIKIIIVMENQGVSATLYYAICTVAAVGIILALVFLGFNMKYRKQQLVKMSSPYLNNLIIVGSIIIYIWMILYGLGTGIIGHDEMKIICQIRHCFLSVGFVIAFGAMFSKTWRVYRVATFNIPQRRIVSDNQLFIIVLALLCFDVVLLITWQIVDPLFVDTSELHLLDDPHTPNLKRQPFFNFCNCNYYSYWLVSIGGYKGLLLIFGTFLAWETRKVTIQELNDSKLIGISVYNVVILCTVGVAVSATITSRPSTLYIFLSSIVLFCTTVTLIVIFVPKIISVIKYPDGRPISTLSPSARNSTTLSIHSYTETSLLTENEQLREKVTKLEQTLAVNGINTRV